MAKRRRAAALFEVIHTDKRFTPRHSTTSYNWWPFKRKESGDEPMDFAPRGPSLLTRLFNLIPQTPRLEVDPESQTVRMQLSYTAALVGVFSIVVALSLAFMIGRQGRRTTEPALAEMSTEELRNGPVQPDVLDLTDDEPQVAMASETTTVGAPKPSAAPVQRPPSARPSPDAHVPATLTVLNEQRTNGLHYVIIQTYPQEEKALADEAVKKLNENGVLCKTELNVPYAPKWICVVGVMGFERVRNSPEFDEYVAQIRKISDKFAGTSKFKQFDPKPFKWRDIPKQ